MIYSLEVLFFKIDILIIAKNLYIHIIDSKQQNLILYQTFFLIIN